MINIGRGSLLFVLWLGCRGLIGGTVSEDSFSFSLLGGIEGTMFLFCFSRDGYWHFNVPLQIPSSYKYQKLSREI